MDQGLRRRASAGGLSRRGLALAIPALAAWPARAAGYPDRPVKIVVPFPAGGGGDLIVRLIAQELTPRLGQNVLVDNKSGAGGDVGTQVVAAAKPDGLTLLMANVAPMAINVSLYEHIPYDPVKDFTAIAPLAVFTNVLLVRPALGVASVAELIALGKQKPGGLTFASAGSGSITHLSAEMFAARTGLKMVHAAYRGGGPAFAALAGGEVDLFFGSLPGGLPFVKAGTLRALAVTSAHRAAAAPEIPTLAEAGLPGFEAVTWIGLVGPAGLPAPIVARLNGEVGAILNQPNIQQHLLDLGAEAWFGSADWFAGYIRDEVARWRETIKQAGLTAG